MRSWFEHVPKVEARAVALSLGAGVALTAAKFLAYFLTGSAAVFSDALESIVNVAAAAFAAYAVAYAHRPADDDHPYGHGKIEFLSAGFEGGMVLLAAAVAAVKSVEAFLRKSRELHREGLEWALLLLGAALVINGVLGLHLIRTGKRYGSITLESDGRHLISDAWASLAALAALAIVRATGWAWVDPLVGLLVALYIAVIGVGLVRRAQAGLMDRQDKNDDLLLKTILDAHLGPGGKEPLICGYHKLRHRHSGRFHWVDFHVVVPHDWNVDRGHRVATHIEEEIEGALGEGNATAHIEPCALPACPACQRREKHADARLPAEN